MEITAQEIEELKNQQKFMSKTLGRFIAGCLTVITFLLTTMVGFIWNLRADFATEQQKSSETKEAVISIKIESKETNQQVQRLREDFKENAARTDARIGVIERTMLSVPQSPGR